MRAEPETVSPVDVCEKNPRMKGCPCFPLPRSIRGKLILSLLIVSGLGVVATLITFFAMLRIEDKIRIIESFSELNQTVLEMRRYEKNYLLYNNREDLMSALDYIDRARASIVTVKQSFPESKEDLQVFYDKELGTYESISRQLIDENLPGLNKRELEEALRSHGQDITKQVFDMDARARIRMEKEVSIYQKIGVLMLFGAVLLGGVLIFFLVRWIMWPLTIIREAAAQIVQGKMDFIPTDEEAMRCSEESLELINSLNSMLKDLNNKQEQLVQSEKLAAIGKFSAGIAHEINNPLNNISLTAEILLEEFSGEENSERLEMIRDILTQSDRAREVVHHLLAFSRSNKNKIKNRVDLVQLMDDSLALVKNQLRMTGVNYDYEHPRHPVTIVGNANQLQQVLVNMMLNSVQSMEKMGGGHLQLRVQEKGEWAVMTVCDTGDGISPELLPHIFEPFVTTKKDGTGLGLSLSYGIIKDHQGEIKVDSEVGNGTTFSIFLPREPVEEG